MARITVEDCLEKVDSQYDLVLLAKERTSQLNAGDKPLVSKDNDKNTVISLREIGEGKVSLKTIEDSAINKLRKIKDEPKELEDLNLDEEDNFDKIYKGEISKSGAAILPSKRVRRIPEKLLVQEAVPNEEVPNEEVPNEEVPNEAVPNEAVPNEAVPNEEVPNEEEVDTAPTEEKSE